MTGDLDGSSKGTRVAGLEGVKVGSEDRGSRRAAREESRPEAQVERAASGRTGFHRSNLAARQA